MATRQKFGSSSTSQYEDFNPKTESKEEPEANILLVHLPDFPKEQLRVTYVNSSRIVRVHGERPLGNNNKWSRFNMVYNVPKNCVVEKIHGNFKDGTLTITMPKETITYVNPKPEPTETPSRVLENPLTDPQKNTSKTTLKEQLKDEAIPKNTNVIASKKPEQTLPNPTKPISPKKLVEQVITKQEEIPKPKIDHSVEKENNTVRRVVPLLGPQKDTSPVVTSSTSNTTKQAENERKKENFTENDKTAKATSDIYESLKKKVDKEKIASGGGFGGPITSPRVGKDEKDKGKEKKNESNLVATKTKELKNVATSAMKRMKVLTTTTMESSEDRQLMVNMGVAVLVIVALGAYITYSIKSNSGKSKH